MTGTSWMNRCAKCRTVFAPESGVPNERPICPACGSRLVSQIVPEPAAPRQQTLPVTGAAQAPARTLPRPAPEPPASAASVTPLPQPAPVGSSGSPTPSFGWARWSYYTYLFLYPHGRIRREVFWLGVLAVYAGRGVLIATTFASSGVPGGWGMIVFYYGCLLSVPPELALHAKRCHDCNRPMLHLLLNAIPIIGWLMYLCEIGFDEGSIGANRYGPPPEDCPGGVPSSEQMSGASEVAGPGALIVLGLELLFALFALVVVAWLAYVIIRISLS